MYVCDALFHHFISNKSFSFAVEEIAWIEKQHEHYSEVKLNVRTSFFWDFFFTGKNTLKAYNDLAQEKMVKLIAEKLGDFLKSMYIRISATKYESTKIGCKEGFVLYLYDSRMDREW